MRLVLVPAATVLALAACTWVPIQPEAQKVRVQRAAPAGCVKVGEIEVEVTDKVALYKRNPLKVSDELETLARNQAAGIPATDIHPLAVPADGRQRFAAWRCAR
ncbi:DUF4156 domain-containing protein [Lysobacter pythonis]|uniref:DUF4156 domain-containing protein n=1 Tax=Solilutibacter pythonis TaxID=2483112 RepID=A0A3M2HZ82_9GAMM|nr:DUF4156 domain-containing protein [Lysobacter pythonis]RMH93163.1 DUF4156 domain-containing protein [Lysobacter pythonis]